MLKGLQHSKTAVGERKLGLYQRSKGKNVLLLAFNLLGFSNIYGEQRIIAE